MNLWNPNILESFTNNRKQEKTIHKNSIETHQQPKITILFPQRVAKLLREMPPLCRFASATICGAAPRRKTKARNGHLLM
jgi:hypothetical protein